MIPPWRARSGRKTPGLGEPGASGSEGCQRPSGARGTKGANETGGVRLKRRERIGGAA